MLDVRSTKKGFTFSVKAKPERIKASSEYQLLRSLSSPRFYGQNCPTTVYNSALFPVKNRLSALLTKVKACKQSNRDRENLLVFLAYQILRTCQAIDLFPHSLM